MRGSTVVAMVAVAALLSGGIATGPAAAQSEMDDGGLQGHEEPVDGKLDDGHGLIQGEGEHFDDDGRVPDDLRRHDFQPNQDRHPTMLDGGRRHDGGRVDPLPPSQQPPPMRPYWGTMQPYWKPIDPNVTKHGGARHQRRAH